MQLTLADHSEQRRKAQQAYAPHVQTEPLSGPTKATVTRDELAALQAAMQDTQKPLIDEPEQ